MTRPRAWTAYVVPHTHWDREWYQPFQVFRARLIDVIDEVVRLLDDPAARYECFTLDGQACVLDDYLEARPEQCDTLARLVKAGRLRIGPWYVLADEYLVSPEALVRNLQHGLERCREFGGALPVAYTPDSFGHVSQLPLIAAGFGLDTIVFERGIGDEGERLGSDFVWVAADGRTSVFAVHLVATYSAATALGHRDWEYRDAYDPARAVAQMRAVLFGPAHGDPSFPDWLKHAIERLPQGVTGYATTPNLLLLNGSDHLFAQANLPTVIDHLEAAIPEAHFVHADVEAYVRAAQMSLEAPERYQGEFRGSRYHHVLSGVWSARMPLKLANHRAQTLLERYAEPLSALAWHHLGLDYRALLRVAWRNLLLNHAHDSVCGCAVDPVAREMTTRFEAVEQLGEDLCRRAVACLTDHVTGVEVVVFEPLPYQVHRVVRHRLEVPDGDAERLVVLAEDGRPLPCQLRVDRTLVAGRSDAYRQHVELLVALETRPLGLTRGRLELRTEPAPDVEPTDCVRARVDGARVTLENATLALSVDETGRLTLLDRTTGRLHRLALRFEDAADAGDTYDFSPLVDAPPIVVDRPVAGPSLHASGPLHALASLAYRLELPGGLAPDRRARVGAAACDVRVSYSLDAFAEHVDVAIEFDNRAEDHRLRVWIASDVWADTVWADGHWDVLQRPLRPPEAPHWYQRPVPTAHQRRFVAISDDHGGLGVLNRGLPEYETACGAEGVDVAVTLLRCVGWLSRDDLRTRPQGAGPAKPTPAAQCHGPQRFELGLTPFAGAWWESRLPLVAERFTAPPRAFTAGPHDPRPDLAPTDAPPEPRSADAPITDGFELTPPLTLSACLPARTCMGVVLRVWNPAPVPVDGVLQVPAGLRAAHLMRLDETHLAPLEHPDGRLTLHLHPKDVISIVLDVDERKGETTMS